ncbi:glycosyltransferase [Chryseobacterium ginsenosidimutans]|uniref:glycosyltransferase family 2 protein n=1 Tax=Chryseobacterium ginsenosidimutans TaxID=687846 RepID=UPI0031D1D294
MKISIALCTYNGEKFIREQIDSILKQTQKVSEIVICDDGSVDSTIEILQNYKNRYPEIFKIHINKKNLKSVKNFEKAIALCTGDIIFLSDQDDIWEREKVKTYCHFIENHSDISVICSNGFIINENSKKIDQYTIWDIPKFFKEKNEIVNYYEIIAFISNIATGASMAIRREFIENILPIPEIEGFHHDEWIALIAAYENKFAMIDDKLFSYRFHENQQVGGVFVEKNDFSKKDLLKKFYSQEYSKNPSVKLSFLKRLKRRERKLKEVYLSTDNKIFNSILLNIQAKRNEITEELKSDNFILFVLYKILGKI